MSRATTKRDGRLLAKYRTHVVVGKILFGGMLTFTTGFVSYVTWFWFREAE